MSLDPHVNGFLQQIAAANRPKTWQLTPAQARESFERLAQVIDARDVAVGKIEHRELPGPGGPLPFRVYTPVDVDAGELAALIFFHGGGFVFGTLDSYDGLCRLLANTSGCRVISISYRLGPEHRFPAAADDAVAATNWIVQNAAALGLDATRIAVGGDSAGANLAAMICQLAKSKGAPQFALQVLLCPVLTDWNAKTESRRLYAEGYLLELETVKYFATHYYGSEADMKDPRASPLLADDLTGLPAAQIHTAEFDPVRDDGSDYADRLKQAGVEVTYSCHAGMIHHFYGMSGVNPNARKIVEEIGVAIKVGLERVGLAPQVTTANIGGSTVLSGQP
jgi:acetyl esterase